GFGEMTPHNPAEPTTEQVEEAVRQCWHNPYYAFSKPAGTSLVCIQGDWSNIADAKIKSGLAAWAMSENDSLYNPLYTRTDRSPHPWGVTALFSEYTGVYPPLSIEWGFERVPPPDLHREVAMIERVEVPPPTSLDMAPIGALQNACTEEEAPPAFSSFREFALAVNRSDPAALALAGHGTAPGFSVD